MTTTPTQPPHLARPAPSAPGGAPPAGALGVTIDPIRLLKRYYLWLIAAGVLGIVLGIVSYYPLRQFFPLFRATTYFRVSPVINSPTDSAAQTIGARGGEAEMNIFMYSQVQDMLSERVMQIAAANGGAIQRQTEWAKRFVSGRTGEYDASAAALDLADVVSARVLPDTQYIALSVTLRSRVDATTIANAVAQAYYRELQNRIRREYLEQEESIDRLLRRIRDEKQRLDQRATRLIGDSKIESVDYRQSEAQTQINSLAPTLSNIRTEIEGARDRLMNYEALLVSPGGPTYPEYLRQQVQSNPVITRYNQELSALRAGLRTLLETHGANHIEVRRTEARIRAVEIERDNDEQRLLAEQFAAVIDGSRDQIRMLEAQQREIETQLTAALTRANELTMLLDEYKVLRADSDRYAQQIAELVRSQEDLRAIMERRIASRVSEIIAAEIPETPIFPRLIILVPVVTILVCGLVGGIILLRELMEQRVRAPSDVTLIPRTRLLGVVPDLSEDPSRPVAIESVTRDKPDGVIAEQFRQLRTAMLKRLAGRTPAAVIFASGLPGSGATSIVANLARSCASLDQKVLVIDANMRRPRLHRILGVAEAPGLADALAGAAFTTCVQRTDMPNLDVIGAGTTGARIYERLNSDAMTNLITEAKKSYALILIDTAPMAVAGDAFVLATRCDAAAMVVRTFAETRGLIARVHGQLSDSRAEFLGVVVNGVKSSAGGYFRRNFRLAHEYHTDADRSESPSKRPAEKQTATDAQGLSTT